MPLTSLFYAERVYRDRPNLPFGWGAGTALLAGAVMTIVGVLIILWAMVGLLTGTIGNATSGSFDIGSFLGGFFGSVMLFVVGGMLAGVGGWILRLWWIFLIVDTVADHRASNRAAAPEVRVRCPHCAALNPEAARYCMNCARPMTSGSAP